jgi:RecA/RadA recombinase
VKKNCIVDGVEFDAKRADAKYCSDTCRKKAARITIADPDIGEVLKPEIVADIKAGRKKLVLEKDNAHWKRFYDPSDPLYEPNPFKRPKDPNYDKKKALAAFIKMGLAEVEWLSTGIPEFDELTKIPRGRITQIQGPYGVGKTTLCLNMVAGMKDAKVLYIDSEAALSPELLVELGLNHGNFTLYNESAYFEDIAEVIRSAAKSGVYDVVILDSLAMTTTRTIAEGDITASNIGQKAKLMHKLVQLTQMDFKNNDTAFVVINQEREVIGSYAPQKYTPGGMAIPYAASLMISLKSIKSWRFPQKPKDGIYLGQEVEATIIKSKVNMPWRVKKFKLYYPNPVVQEQDVQLAQKAEF